MANFAYTYFKLQNMKGLIDFQEAGDDIRIMLVMTNSTADTEEDTDFLDQFTTLDEMDGANYVAYGKALANQTTTQDDANDRAEFSADAVTWAALGAGTRNVLGAIVYKFVTDQTDSIPIAYIDTGGFPFAATGANVTFTPNAEGILQIT